MNFNYNHFLVTERSKTIRAIARQTLSGRWFECLIFVFAVYLITSLPSLIVGNFINSRLIALIVTIYTFWANGFTSLSCAYFFLKVFRQKEASLDDVKYGFTFWNKAVSLYAHVYIRIIIGYFLFVIPGILATIKYSQAFYILADHPEKRPMQCVVESRLMMDGNKIKYVKFQLSYIGWYILAGLPQFSFSMYLMPAGVKDPSELWNAAAQVNNHPLVFLLSLLTLLLTVYVSTGNACFYDLAAGNLSVGGNIDYSAARGYADNPFTNQESPFRDVPVQNEKPAEMQDSFENNNQFGFSGYNQVESDNYADKEENKNEEE